MAYVIYTNMMQHIIFHVLKSHKTVRLDNCIMGSLTYLLHLHLLFYSFSLLL